MEQALEQPITLANLPMLTAQVQPPILAVRVQAQPPIPAVQARVVKVALLEIGTLVVGVLSSVVPQLVLLLCSKFDMLVASTPSAYSYSTIVRSACLNFVVHGHYNSIS